MADGPQLPGRLYLDGEDHRHVRRSSLEPLWRETAAVDAAPDVTPVTSRAATSGPVSHKIMFSRPGQCRRDQDRSSTCRGCGQEPPGHAGRRPALTDARAGPD